MRKNTEMETEKIGLESILSFLRGGKDESLDLDTLSKTNPEDLVRCIQKLIQTKDYHIQNNCRALLSVLNKSSPIYRGIAWELFQRIPLSHFLEIMNVKTKKDNTKRLRHCIVTKLANSDRNSLFRAYFMMPKQYRNCFQRLYLPRDNITIKDEVREITNENYKLAYKLSTLSKNEVIKEFNISFSFLLKTLGLPLHEVMDLVTSPEEVKEIAMESKGDTFFEHARWFRNILGDELYEEIGLKKVKWIKDPLSFLAKEKRKHLEETGSFTPKMFDAIEIQAENVIEEVMKKFKLERLSLIVDLSRSMESAKVITIQLYEAFSRTNNIVDLIGFNQNAILLSLERLKEYNVGGYTSIEKAISLLAGRLRERKANIPQAILLISDLDENTPYNGAVNRAFPLLKEFGDPPLIVIHCGTRKQLTMEYPHAIIEVDNFHPSLMMNILKEIARLTSKVAVKEEVVTKTVKQRRPIEEEIGMVELWERPAGTYKPGYLGELLCPK
jgi:hypothetical protein